jgi:hypothetical protein
VNSVYTFLGGRSMTAFWALFIVGSALAFSGKLTGDFVTLGGLLHSFVIVRAISEDKFCNGKQEQPADDQPKQRSGMDPRDAPFRS